MRPDISRVIAHEYRDVAYDLDGACLAVRPQRRPLLEERELQRLGRRNLLRKIFADSFHPLWFPPRQLARPLAPCALLVAPAQNIEQGEVIQPPCVLLLEAFKARA